MDRPSPPSEESNTTEPIPSPCSWPGVSCDDDHVTRIILNARDCRGSIPSNIGKLEFLQQLYLYSNFLTGYVPEQLGNLKRLTHLSLGENQLEGTIPTTLGGMHELRYMYLFGNRFTGGIPSSLGNLINLVDLGLWDNKLTGSIPNELGKLKKIRYFAVNGNSLSGPLPYSIFHEMIEVFPRLQSSDLNMLVEFIESAHEP